MKVSGFSAGEFFSETKSSGVSIQIGPFIVKVHSSIRSVAEGLHLLYADYPVVIDGFRDFHVSLCPPSLIRKYYKKQVNFYQDKLTPFKPLPYAQALPMFEWGLNWSITSAAHQYLMLHSAVVEKNGFALALPAPPGSGKSTLCAGLVSRGWRLLSDEMALIPRSQAQNGSGDIIVVPIARPISLKNRSIDVITDFAPDETIGPLTFDTTKGTVAHMKPPGQSVEKFDEAPVLRWIVFPRYATGADTSLVARSRARSFLEVAQQAFNFNVLGLEGFELLKNIVTQCECFDFEYSDLNQAVSVFDDLAGAVG